MASETRSRRADPHAAFTLVELLLTVALVLMFAGAVILSFGSLDRNTRLEEGASQVETLFRYARAQAANTGRQVRIIFGAGASATAGVASPTNAPPTPAGTNTGFQVLWEPDPVDAPGRFESFLGAQLLLDQVNDLVKVLEVGQPGTLPSQSAGLGLGTGMAALPTLFQGPNTNGVTALDNTTNLMPPLTCYPDGSSDSMEIVLAPASGEDKRLAVLTFSGLAGTTRRRLVTPVTDGAWAFDDADPADPGTNR